MTVSLHKPYAPTYVSLVKPASTDLRDGAHAAALARRAEGYAAKYVAETVKAEPAAYVPPTDATMAATFATCCRVPGADEYPTIRAAMGRLAGCGWGNLCEHGPDETSCAFRPAGPELTGAQRVARIIDFLA